MDKKAIRDLKEEYLLAHEYYEGDSERLRDLTTRSMYESLMRVSSVSDLDSWVAAMRKTEICFSKSQTPTSVYRENLLAAIEFYASDMAAEEKELAVAGFVKIRSNGFEHCSRADIDCLMKDYSRKHAKKDSGQLIFIFRDPYGDCVVVDKDADAIFEKTGWQTDVLEWQGRKYSYMFLNEKQVELLGYTGLSSVTTTKAVVSDICYMNSMEHLFCEAQQEILAFMYTLEERTVIPVLFERHTVEDGVDTVRKYISMDVDRLSLTLYDTGGMPYRVVDDFTWPVIGRDYVFVMEIAEYINCMQEDREKGRADSPLSSEFDHAVRVKSGLSYFEHGDIKEDLDDRIVIINHSSLYISYGDDAVALAGLLGIPLWFRWIGDEQVVMAIVPKHLAEGEACLYPEIIVCSSCLQDSLEYMRLTPCFVTDGTRFDLDYHDACVFKRKDGSYAVRAFRSCAEMPCAVVPKEKAEFYLSLSDSLLKEACMKAILLEAYHSVK